MSTYGGDCEFSRALFAKLEELNRSKGQRADLKVVARAVEFAKRYHHGQLRATGEPFYSHTLAVAGMVADYCHKSDVIVASVLHDVVEDTSATIGDVLDNFGWKVAQIVNALTRKRPSGQRVSAALVLENAARAGDSEAMLIKILDRLHNLQTLSPMSIRKQKRIAMETIQNFLNYASEFDPKLEKTLNLLSLRIVEPSLVAELERLYEGRFGSEIDKPPLPKLGLVVL